MSRTVYFWDKDTQSMITDAQHAAKQDAKRQSHYVIQDSMDPIKHPATGQMFDSKSAFRAENKARGLVEVGNDWNGKPWKEPELKSPDFNPMLSEYLDKH